LEALEEGMSEGVKIACRGADSLPLDAIEEFQGDLKKRGKVEIEQIITSIQKYGFSFPFFRWSGDGHNRCLDGHGRIQALGELRRRGVDLPLFPVAYVEAKDEAEAKQKLLRLNSQYGQMTLSSVIEFMDGLEIKWDELNLPSKPLEYTDETLSKTALKEEFGIFPSTILDATSKPWQERNAHWKNLIKDYGESRELVLNKGKGTKYKPVGTSSGCSVLNPTLAELMIKWFSLPGGKAFDCFAGDSVFGYVASFYNNTFTGIEIREEQAKINNDRVKEFPGASYICGDGINVAQYIETESQDFLFSCPPYFNLEKYSDLEGDASNQKNYEAFIEIIKKAFIGALSCLKPGRFAVIVAGDIRRNDGFYYRFPDDIKTIFETHGAPLYCDLILRDPIGSARYRARANFRSRKIIKVHQNVMVFFKGDPKNIKDTYPEIPFCDTGKPYLYMDGEE
jgi:hypothetical protein